MKHVEMHKQYLKRKAINEAAAKAPKEMQKRTLQQLSLEVERTKILLTMEPKGLLEK